MQMTTREAVDEALYCMGECIMNNASLTDKGRDTIHNAMLLLCDYYGFSLKQYICEETA